jgi:hypothetical protein
MGKYQFKIWEPIGTVTVEAKSEGEALEKVEELGWDDNEGDGISFDPFNDGQEWEIR